MRPGRSAKPVAAFRNVAASAGSAEDHGIDEAEHAEDPCLSIWPDWPMWAISAKTTCVESYQYL